MSSPRRCAHRLGACSRRCLPWPRTSLKTVKSTPQVRAGSQYTSVYLGIPTSRQSHLYPHRLFTSQCSKNAQVPHVPVLVSPSLRQAGPSVLPVPPHFAHKLMVLECTGTTCTSACLDIQTGTPAFFNLSLNLTGTPTVCSQVDGLRMHR